MENIAYDAVCYVMNTMNNAPMLFMVEGQIIASFPQHFGPEIVSSKFVLLSRKVLSGPRWQTL